MAKPQITSRSGRSRVLPSLVGAACIANPSVVQILTVLETAGGEARIVGGAVRDTLLGRFRRQISDVDIATTLPPQDVVSAAKSAGIKAVPTGLEHGTITLVLGGCGLEVTTLRRDVQTDGRRAVVAFTDDWHEDAKRRDFTMNALYADRYGTLYDPLGGYDDLMARRVRFIGEAQTRIEEDALRILRFFRFLAELGREGVDGAGYSACVTNKARLNGLSRERVRHEILRLLKGPGAMLAVEAMDNGGIFGELHVGTVYLRRLQRFLALDTSLSRAGEAILRLGALCLGGAKTAKYLGETLRLSGAETKRLALLEASGPVAIDNQMISRDMNQLCYHFGKAAALEKIQHVWADGFASLDDDGWRNRWQYTAGIELDEFPLSGADLVAAGVMPGPDLGKKLKALENLWIDSDFTMSAADLKAMIDEA